MAEYSGEKTHEATPHRREEARKKGYVALSQDLGSAVLFLAGMGLLLWLGPAGVQFFEQLLYRQLGEQAWLVGDSKFIVTQWNQILWSLSTVVLPILGLLFASGVAGQVVQAGFLFVPERVAPDLSRINPMQGWQRIFSLSGAVRLGFGLLKVLVIGVVAILSLHGSWAEMNAASQREPQVIGWFLAQLLLWTGMKIGLALLVLAILDYFYQRWKHELDLRMTHQELREELKNYQGDPQLIARRRAVQRQLVLHRLSSIVPKADVVITNPTELAVAIRYVPEEMLAPIVIAKGAGIIAQRIRKLAVEHRIPVVEKKPLAQALYRDVELNQPIPDRMYAAVAEVLAYVYQLQGKSLPHVAA